MSAARSLLSAAVCMVAMLAPMSADAAVRALLIGVNAYQGPPPLRGAVNDIRDVAAVFARLGIETDSLIDGEARRSEVIARYRQLLSESVPGDSLYVHFAGHGISIPDDNGDEADGRDESYLLAGFDEETAPDEQLIDDDLDVLFQEAEARQVSVTFVADACHSGSPARAVAGEGLPTRLYQPKTTPSRPAPVGSAPTGADRSLLTVVGATLDDRTVPELIIDGAPRGALSYAVARALEGHGDLDGDGRVVASEFEVFVRQTVRNLAASKQTPQFDVPMASRAIITFGTGRRPLPLPGIGLENAPMPALSVFVEDGSAYPKLLARLQQMEGVELVSGHEAASLILDPARGEAMNAVRDVIAAGLDPLADFPRVIEAQRALEGINRMAIGGLLSVDFFPGDAVQRAGTEIAFVVERPKKPYLTAFDLTATGAVQPLWPLAASDPDPWPASRSFEFSAIVSPPFGADTLVIVATDAPPEALRAILAGAAGGVRPASVYAALEETRRVTPMVIGVQAFFTEAAP